MFELLEKNSKEETSTEMSYYSGNDNLKNATEKITKYHEITKNAILGISMILSNICEYPAKYFENSKFNTIAEYAEEAFGYKKSYTYKLIRIAKFISIKDKNGEAIDVSYLIDDKIEDDYYFDVVKDSDGFEYTPSQLLELIPLTKEQIETNIAVLDSSLTCKELRAIVKDIVSPPIETKIEESESDSNENSEENKQEEKPLTDKERIMQMLEICSQMEDEGIKEKIINVFQKSLKALEK